MVAYQSVRVWNQVGMGLGDKRTCGTLGEGWQTDEMKSGAAGDMGKINSSLGISLAQGCQETALGVSKSKV